MAPIHHHFELLGLVGDEDHPALLDRGRDLLGDRLHAVPAVDHVTRSGRRCPPGPYLVVGLARSGAAAARMLRAHGEVIGVRLRPARGADLGRRGCTSRATASSCSTGSARVVKSPGVPSEAPVIAAARERGLAVVGELELAWRLLPQRVRRGDRHERQDDDGRAARRDPARGRAAGGGGRQRRARRCRRSWARSSPRPRSCARRRASSSRTRRRSRRSARVLLNLEPDHLDRHGELRGLPRGEAARVRQPDARARGDRAAGLGAAGRRRGASSSPRLPLPAERAPPARRAQPRERDGGGGRGAGARACRARRWRRRCAPSRGVPHRLEEVGDGRAACST